MKRRDLRGYLGAGRGWPDGADRAEQARGRKPNRERRHRLALLREHPWCSYCGTGLDEESATLDHYIPLSRGGSRARANCRLACQECNREKADRMPE